MNAARTGSFVSLALVTALALAAPARLQYDPANPEATDPHHIYVHPGEPDYNPNEPNDMPTPDPSQLYPPASDPEDADDLANCIQNARDDYRTCVEDCADQTD